MAAPSTISMVNKTAGREVSGRMELDSHADTCVLGINFVILEYSGRVCDVYPYSSEYNAIKDVPIVKGATAIQDQQSGETIILVINEGLWYGSKLDHSLINPNQLRHFGIEVCDNPYAAEGMFINEPESGVNVPLQARGTIIFANSFAPTDHELQTCQHIVLTSPSLWNPQTVRLGEISSGFTDDMDDEYYQRSTAYEHASRSYFIDTDSIYLSHISAAYVDTPPPITSYISTIDIPPIKNFVSKKRHTNITPEDLSSRWHIGVKQAQRTLDCTTQNYTRSALLPLSRRYRNDRMFYRRILNHQFAADLYMARTKSLHGNTCAYLFAHKCGFAQVYPQTSKESAQAADSLRQFSTDFGIPRKLIVDGALEQVGRNTEFIKRCRTYDIDLHVSTPRRPRENPAEGVIREVRKKWFRLMQATDMPKRLWDYGLKWVTEVMQRTATSSYHSQGRTPLEIITGDTPDISEYLDFGIYDWVLFKENAGFGETKLGRMLGISHRVGQMMSYWILPISCTVISCTTVQRLTLLDQQQDVYKERCKHFDTTIKERLRDANNVIVLEEANQPYDWDNYDFSQDQDFLSEYGKPLVVSDPSIAEADALEQPLPKPPPTPTPDAFDNYLHMEIALPRGVDESMQFARVKRRKIDDDGIPVGVANDNPLLDNRVYVVEWLDGHTEELMANVIAENLFAQVDDEGNRFVLLDDIVDHRKSEDALSGDDGYIVMENGMRHRRRTTQGWELCVQWKDQSTTWVALKDMKNAFPLEVADYAIANKIDDEPAFAWWVPFTIKKRQRYISKIKSKYWQRTHKYGIEIPKSVAHALELDAKNGDTRWWDAIMKEMANVRVAFQKFEGEKQDLPPGFQEIKCHMIFDVKLGENFRRKARYVAGGHVTDPPATTTYSSVVSRESVRIALLIAALNDLEVLSADIQNAYLHAKCREKIWCRAGAEFGSDQGCVMIIVRALYGLKTSGAAFRSLLADRLYDIGYKSTKGDPDVWIRPAVKPDGFEYYEMVLVYVDDIFAISHEPTKTLEQIQEEFKFKNDEIAPPDMYLGSKLQYQQFNGTKCWTMSSDKYVNAAIENVEAKLKLQGKKLPGKADTPMISSYRPEEDTTAELQGTDHTYFQELIGILRWAIELGRVDIMLEVSMLSVHLAMPRAGHLEAAIHIFAYLKTKPKKTIAFDPRHPVYDESIFPPKADWHDFYREAVEQIPDDAPPARGNMVSMHCFVDASHAQNRVSRKSQTGILIFINRSLTSWFSKQQNTVESSTFGSEFIAMKTAVEMLQALRYKLRWFGVPIDGPVNVFGDNESVVNSAQKPEVTLSKKHNGIAYHKVREAVAGGWIRVAWVNTTQNLADILTKVLPRAVRDRILDFFMY